MKKLVFFIVATLMASIGISQVSCNDKHAEFLKEIEEQNKMCPIVDSGCVTTKVAYEDECFTIYFSYDSTYSDYVDRLNTDASFRKTILLSTFFFNSPDGGIAVDYGGLSKFIDADVGYRQVINCPGHEEFVMKLTHADLKEFYNLSMNNPHKAFEDVLKAYVDRFNKVMPFRVEERTEIQSIELQDSAILTTMLFEEDVRKGIKLIDVVDADSFRNYVLDNGFVDRLSRDLLSLCRVSDTDIIYRLIGTQSRDTMDIEISSYSLWEHYDPREVWEPYDTSHVDEQDEQEEPNESR